MAVEWHKFKTYPGVRYRNHSSRRHGKKHDQCFSIRYKLNGKDREEVVGWSSEGMTGEKAYRILMGLKTNARTGTGPVSLAEKRSQEKAEREALQRRAESEKRTALSLTAYWDAHYAPYARLEKTPETWRREESNYKTWLLPNIGSVLLNDLRPADFDRIQIDMRQKNKAPRSIQLVFAVMRAVWNHAQDRGFVAIPCPVLAVKIGRINNARTRILSQSDAATLLEEIKKIDVNAWEFTLACLHTGGRLGEVARLTWGNVDLAGNHLTLMHTKTGTPRSIPLSQTLKILLQEKFQGNPDELVFTNAKGQQWLSMPTNYRKALNTLEINKGRDDRRDRLVFHSLRHCAASMMLETGEDIRTIQEIFGWSTLAMVQRYLHPTAENKVRAINNLDNLLKGGNK